MKIEELEKDPLTYAFNMPFYALLGLASCQETGSNNPELRFISMGGDRSIVIKENTQTTKNERNK